MLELTGHPLVDVGILTITAHAGKTNPADVTEAHLDAMADVLEKLYLGKLGRNFGHGVIFPNFGFWQPSYSAEKKAAYANLVLRGYRASLDLKAIASILEYDSIILRDKPDAPPCVFTGKPAYLRADRGMIPLLNGRTVINFGGLGTPGLPVSALALLAIHAMPLGCVISQGRLLAAESDDPELMLELARENLGRNLEFFQMASLESVPNTSSFRTRLIETLVKVFRAPAAYERFESRAPSLTAYHFSNSGQDAKIDIYPLPSPVVRFVFEAERGESQSAWNRIVSTAWMEQKPEEEELRQARPKLTRRNFVYEDLFDLPDEAEHFLRTYILRHPMSALRNDPRAQYNTLREADLISWELTDLFLRRMMNVNKGRIDKIRELGDALATHIQRTGNRRLLREMYLTRKNEYWKFRAALMRAIQRHPDAEPLCPFDTYITIFEEGEEGERLDWDLARDLLLIRVFEQLHRVGWLGANVESLQEEEQAENAAS